jgi:hypothetical protein
LAIAGKDVATEFQWEQRPHIFITTQDNVTATAAVAAVGSTLRDVLCTVEMARAGAPLTTAAKDLNVVYKVRVCHKS